jgi:DNA-directed RNA polymerase specialized sigma24 family protein
MDELIRYMRASMLLQIYLAQVLSERPGAPSFRPEVLLADAGISTKEIASMLGKSPAAVAKAISRARAARRPDESGGGGEALP